ncbi:ScbR family autoregulator-binding transcription factor [Streptomyces triticirhizae]|uniref:TetR/AcrR family transcriptional regulator n=1 Tax=Streptomyces triticirhizae TaxID=2483353 RepID=A0A3M2LT19_9ACTN|nr:ScbR family autoregulator-binding transcription factor [Streptomyces triticirhizae]RMI40624.1 TetR/AcrR family transcriptional regulator [Streptomyces triticirhizae]
MARQERAERTRNIILDGAARAFDATGFQGTSLSDIVREAGVTKGALYFHFASKEALAQAIITEQFTVWDPFRDDEEPGVQTVIDLLHTMAESLQKDVRVRAGIRMVIEQGTFEDPDPAPYQRWMDAISRCLTQAQSRGDVLPDVDPEEAASFIVGCWTGLQLSSQVFTGRADLHRSTTTMWQLLLPGLVPPRRLGRFRPEGSGAATEANGQPVNGDAPA